MTVRTRRANTPVAKQDSTGRSNHCLRSLAAFLSRPSENSCLFEHRLENRHCRARQKTNQLRRRRSSNAETRKNKERKGMRVKLRKTDTDPRQ